MLLSTLFSITVLSPSWMSFVYIVCLSVCACMCVCTVQWQWDRRQLLLPPNHSLSDKFLLVGIFSFKNAQFGAGNPDFEREFRWENWSFENPQSPCLDPTSLMHDTNVCDCEFATGMLNEYIFDICVIQQAMRSTSQSCRLCC